MPVTPPHGPAEPGPDPVQAQTAQAISHTLVRVMKIMTAMKHHAPRDHSAVDPSHYPLMFSVCGEPRRVSAVADSIHSDVSTVSRQVTHLVQHGLLEKIGDPDDGRAQLLSLSPAGREVIEKLVERRGSWFEQIMATWTDEEARTFERYLSRFGDDVEVFKAQVVAGGGSPSLQAPEHPPQSPSPASAQPAGPPPTPAQPAQPAQPAAPVAFRPDADAHFLTTLSRTNQELSRER